MSELLPDVVLGRAQAYLNARAARLAPPEVIDSQDGKKLLDRDLRALMALALKATTPHAINTRALTAEVEQLREATKWHKPEAINAAAGSAHRVTLGPASVTKVEHHIGCYENGARRHQSGTPLICPFEHYLDAVDAEDTPAPSGAYWVTIEVFGPAEEPPASTWERVDAPDAPGAHQAGYNKAIAEACRAWGISGTEDLAADDGPTCILCGCTEEAACEGGCAWLPNDLGVDVCTRCARRLSDALVRGTWQVAR